jgi:hypothetical protein
MSEKSEFTRRELYNLVWKKPVENLARDFGMSGRGLSKLCERNGIPVPPRGYWARVANGQKIAKPPLIEIGDVTESQKIAFSLPSPKIAEKDNAGPAQRLPAKPFKDIWVQQISELPDIKVSDTLTKPHPLVVAILDEEARSERFTRKYSFSDRKPKSKDEKSLERKRLRVLDVIFKTLTDMQLSIEHNPVKSNSIIVEHGSDRVEFTVSEHIRQYRRALTEKELGERIFSSSTWTQDREATGKLELRIHQYTPDGVPEVFRETDDVSLDVKLKEALAALIATLAYNKLRREEAAAAERRRWEQQMRAYEAEQARKLEKEKREA